MHEMYALGFSGQRNRFVSGITVNYFGLESRTHCPISACFSLFGAYIKCKKYNCLRWACFIKRKSSKLVSHPAKLPLFQTEKLLPWNLSCYVHSFSEGTPGEQFFRVWEVEHIILILSCGPSTLALKCKDIENKQISPAGHMWCGSSVRVL